MTTAIHVHEISPDDLSERAPLLVISYDAEHILPILLQKISTGISFSQDRLFCQDMLPNLCRHMSLMKFHNIMQNANMKKTIIGLFFDIVMYADEPTTTWSNITKQFNRDEAMKKLFYNGRHIGFWPCIFSQFLFYMQPSLRAQLQGIVLYRPKLLGNDLLSQYIPFVHPEIVTEVLSQMPDDKALYVDLLQDRLCYLSIPPNTSKTFANK